MTTNPAGDPPTLLDEDGPEAPYLVAARNAFEASERAQERLQDPAELQAWAALEARMWGRRPRRPLLAFAAGAGALAVAALCLWLVTPARRPGEAGGGAAVTAAGPAAKAIEASPAAPPSATAAGERPEPETVGAAGGPAERVAGGDPAGASRASPSRALPPGSSLLASGVRARLSSRGAASIVGAGAGSAPGARRGDGDTAGGDGETLVLDHGTLDIDGVPAAAAGAPPVSVRVAAYRMEAGGGETRGPSRFHVSARDGEVRVHVEKGEVAVWSRARLVTRLVAGQRWTSLSGAGARAPLDPADDAASGTAPAGAVPGEAPGADSPDCLHLARDGRTDEAVGCLEAQAARPGLPGELALLELARIRRDVRGDLAGAERALGDYRRRFPHGSLLAEAGTARVELLLKLERPADALAEAERLPGAGDGTFWRAVCLAKLGRNADARHAFEDYLARPDGRRRAEAARRLKELAP